GRGGVMRGDSARAGPRLREILASAQAADTPLQLAFAGSAALFVGDDAAASDLLGRAVAAARAAGAISILARLLAQLAAVQAWTSRWPLAVATASPGLRPAAPTGPGY